MLVDHDHAPWTQNSKNPHIFKNRWPLEAAIKVATKDFIYENGAETVEIGLRDVSAENESGTAEVHVFEVSRRREVAVDIPKFKGFRNAWVGQAKKLRTERFLTRDAVLSVLGSPTKS